MLRPHHVPHQAFRHGALLCLRLCGRIAPPLRFPVRRLLLAHENERDRRLHARPSPRNCERWLLSPPGPHDVGEGVLRDLIDHMPLLPHDEAGALRLDLHPLGDVVPIGGLGGLGRGGAADHRHLDLPLHRLIVRPLPRRRRRPRLVLGGSRGRRGRRCLRRRRALPRLGLVRPGGRFLLFGGRRPLRPHVGRGHRRGGRGHGFRGLRLLHLGLRGLAHRSRRLGGQGDAKAGSRERGFLRLGGARSCFGSPSPARPCRQGSCGRAGADPPGVYRGHLPRGPARVRAR
mmetsp:Transcript_9669/g.23944  ORF Transcript_9669/g.23944 Transcript_9669/m.23944 type:complete len:288 (+) Transcript_9669:735-1598(+)